MKALLTGLLALLALAQPAHAAPGTGAKKAFEISHQMVDVRDVRLQPYARLKLRGNFNIRYLMGEPVVGCTALWLNPGVSQVETEGGNRVLAEAGEEDLYNLMLVAQFPNPLKGATRHTNGGGAFLSVFCDAGIVAQTGKNGFNVSGSPNWDEFLCATPYRLDTSRMNAINRQERDLCTSVRGTWLTREEARKVAAGNIEITDVQVHGFEINNSDTVRRAEKMAWRKTSFARTKTKFKGVMTRLYDTLPQSSWARLGTLSADAQLVEGRVVGSPSATDVKAYDTLLDRALAELEAARKGERDAMQESWQAEDREMIGKQLSRVRGVDETLSRMDSAMARYEEDLREAAKDAPVDPLAQYFTVAESLKPTRSSDTSSLYGLKDRSGRFVLAPRYHQIIPFGAVEGGFLDLYEIKDTQDLTHDLDLGGAHAAARSVVWVADARGNRISRRFPASHIGRVGMFGGTGGVLSFVVNGHLPILYSLPQDRIILNPFTSKPASNQINRKPVTLVDGRTVARDQAATELGYHIRQIGERFYAYATLDTQRNQPRSECQSGRTDGGNAPGIYPVYAYDIMLERYLTIGDLPCVPI